MNDNTNKIRITSDDLQNAQVAPPQNGGNIGARQWGSISNTPAGSAHASMMTASGGSFFLKSWVYLGIAGAAGAFLAWALAEPSLADVKGEEGWGNDWIVVLVIIFICVGLALAESIAERSTQKAIVRGFLALILGLALGWVFDKLADNIYEVGRQSIPKLGFEKDLHNPVIWLVIWFVRGIAWMVFGISCGIVYGIVGKSPKKGLYGVIGGVLGAGVGAFLFDPISLLVDGAEVSRFIGFTIFGACTGVAIGLVESALKDRWLYVSSGPLSGKQFILYKPVTKLGSLQSNDIYLFKDPEISPTHASIELRGSSATLKATGSTFVAGQPVTQRVLRSGDIIQIGRYTFQYQEKKTHS